MFGHPPPQDTTATRIPAEPLPALRARHGGARPPASSSSHPTSWGSPRAPLALGAARLPPALGVPCLTPAPPLLLLPWPLPVSCPDGAPCPAPFTWVPSRPVPSLRFPVGTVPSQAPGPSHASWLLALLQARPQSCPRPWSWGGTSVSNVTAASWVTGERGLRAMPPAAPTRGGQRRDSACRPGCCREERRPPLTLASRGPRGRRGRGRPRSSSRLPASGLP